jgi:Protein kinase domain/Leucine Rich Repeat
LVQVVFQSNSLTGAIPDSIGNLSNLQYLRFAFNNLSSTIPRGVWNLKNLIQLSVSSNFLEGSISSDVASIETLDILDLANNRLTGRIPNSLGQLTLMELMDFSYNSFSGPIPVSLGNILNINYINLSCNNLSGTIPKSLANLKYLVELNLSYNNLEGEIPTGGVFSNITLQYLVGNGGLCGAPSLGLAPCNVKVAKSNLHLLKVILPVVASALMFICFCIIFIYWWRTKPTLLIPTTTSLKEYSAISCYELLRATQNFSESNLLGSGGFSTVYKGELDNGTIVAIKILNLQSQEALKTFDYECIVLGMIRHRKLVKVISTCSNIDFKAIVLQFMPNGNLEQWIHSPTSFLNLAQRLNVALDVAQGLEYLHHHHHHVVLHYDIKPSNVLLDEGMNAHLSDFGIAKIVADDRRTLISTGAIGTIGYMPPGNEIPIKLLVSIDIFP